MPLIIADRVRETTTTTGTGSIGLAGPYAGFQAFSIIGNGNTTYYVIVDALNIAWEVGIGTYSSAGNTLARTTVLASSNAGSLVNFGVGPKDVMLTQPAQRSVLVQQGGAGLLTGTAAFTANGVPYANSTSTLTTGSALTFDGATFANTAGEIAAAGTVAGGGLYSYAVGGEGGQISLANPTNTGNVASFDVVDATTARLFTTINNAVLQIGQLAGTGGVVSLFTNSTERMRIDSAGNVGIGTSSPGAGTKLNVAGRGLFTGGSIDPFDGTLSGVSISYDTVNNIGFIAAVQTGVSERQMSMRGNPLTFLTNGANERMRIDSTGNVGIGTSTPVVRLQVEGNIRGGSPIVSGNYTISLQSGTSDTTNLTRYSSGIGEIRHVGGPFQVVASDATALILGTSSTERMRIDSDGNVGIGTSSPDAGLTVIKSATISSQANVAARIGAGTTSDLLLGSVNGNSPFVASQGAYPLLFNTNSTERMRIDANGNLIQSAPTTPPTLTTNGQMVFNLTSDTNLRVSVRGSDGVTRTANITLA